MQIDVTGHHIEITAALRDYVTTKFKKLERHLDNVTDAHVVLDTEKLLHKAEANVRVRGANIFAESQHEDMYAAIDSLIDKIDRQLRKHKDKKTDHHRSEGGIKSQHSA